MSKNRPTARSSSSKGRAGQRPPSRRVSTNLVVAVAVAVVVVAGGLILLNAMQSWASPAVSGLITNSATKGSPDAKVTITEYSDFQCPWCGRYALTTGRQIDEQYVRTGKVKVVFRNRAVIGDESVFAAQAALCAGDQGKFWEYHDKLFSSQAGENQGAFSKTNLKRFAADLRLNTGAFNSCLDGGKYFERVSRETAESNARGVTATPTFFINNQKIEGAQPFDDFKAVIDEELRRAQ